MEASPITAALEQLRSPLERNLSESEIINHILLHQKIAIDTAPYAVGKKLVKYLLKVGINYSEFSCGSHAHPAHKNLENAMLAKLAYTIKEDFTAIFCKPEKVHRELVGPFSNHNINVAVCNPIQTGKDTTRYNSLTPTTFNQINGIITPSVFIHDALHYLTVSQIDEFYSRNPAVKRIYATLMCPVELRSYAKNTSAYPELYTLVHHDDGGFTYLPEDDEAGAYEQDVKQSVYWLDFFDSTGHNEFSMDILQTWYAQHLVMFSRDQYPVRTKRVFTFPKLTSIRNFVDVEALGLSQDFIDMELFKEWLLYALSVNKAKPSDMIGTLRAYLKNGANANLDVCLSLISILCDYQALELDPGLLRFTEYDIKSDDYYLGKIKEFNNVLQYVNKADYQFLKKLALAPYQIIIDNKNTPAYLDHAIGVNLSTPLGASWYTNVDSYFSDNFDFAIERVKDDLHHAQHLSYKQQVCDVANNYITTYRVYSQSGLVPNTMEDVHFKIENKKMIAIFCLIEYGLDEFDLLPLPDDFLAALARYTPCAE
ncbi:19997_t:CDS:1, partial [Cetraspora pellucida]